MYEYPKVVFFFPTQQVFALFPNVLVREATNTNFIVFGLTRSGLEPTSYRTRGEHTNHYTTDAVPSYLRRAYLYANHNTTDNELL